MDAGTDGRCPNRACAAQVRSHLAALGLANLSFDFLPAACYGATLSFLAQRSLMVTARAQRIQARARARALAEASLAKAPYSHSAPSWCSRDTRAARSLSLARSLARSL